MIDRLEGDFGEWADRGELALGDPALAAQSFVHMVRGDVHFQVALGIAAARHRRP